MGMMFIIHFCYIELVHQPHIVPNFKSYIDFTFFRYACGYGLEDKRGDPNHHQSIKQGCLVQFSIRRLYTQFKVPEIIFDHRPHTRVNG